MSYIKEYLKTYLNLLCIYSALYIIVSAAVYGIATDLVVLYMAGISALGGPISLYMNRNKK